MQEFMLFLEELVCKFPLHVEIGYNHVCDWSIYIYKQGCANDYPNSSHNGNDAIVVNVQNSDMQLAFAQAHCDLKEWLLENNGGY